MAGSILARKDRISLGNGFDLRLLSALEVLQAGRESGELAEGEREQALCSDACLLARALERTENRSPVFSGGREVLAGLTAEEIAALTARWRAFSRESVPELDEPLEEEPEDGANALPGWTDGADEPARLWAGNKPEEDRQTGEAGASAEGAQTKYGERPEAGLTEEGGEEGRSTGPAHTERLRKERSGEPEELENPDEKKPAQPADFLEAGESGREREMSVLPPPRADRPAEAALPVPVGLGGGQGGLRPDVREADGLVAWAEQADRIFRRDSRRYDGGFYLY